MVEDSFFECVECGEQWYVAGQMEETMRRAREALRQREGRQ